MVDGIIHDSLHCEYCIEGQLLEQLTKVIRLLLVSYVECTDVPISAITVLYRDMERFYMLLYWSRHLFLFLFLEGHCLHTVQEPLQVCEIRLSGPVAMDNHVVHEGQWSEYFRRK